MRSRQLSPSFQSALQTPSVSSAIFLEPLSPLSLDMAAKRLRNETDEQDMDKVHGKKRRKSLHELANVLEGILAGGDIKLFAFVLEPMIRKVVHEEVERGLSQSVKFPLRYQPGVARTVNDSSASVKLVFEKPLSLPVFTGSKMEDEDGNPLRIILVDTAKEGRSLVNASPPIKAEMVVVDGDFPGTREEWTSEEFEKNIVRERAGKRPLITGDVSLSLKGGSATIGDISFTDNSSWIRSRQFRIGVKVAGGSHGGIRIKEAMTEPFTVKDHRGESYKKHHPPAPNDEVWRLEKIGKDGAYHKRLQAERINTVRDFVLLALMDPERLRSILGPNMPEKMWETMVAHAKTCEMDGQHHPLQLERRVLGGVNGMQGLLVNTQPQPALRSSPTTPHMRQLVQRESYEVFGQATFPHHGATVPQIGYDFAALPPVAFLSANEEMLITAANHGAGIDETMNSSLGLRFTAGWYPDTPSDQDSQGEFFDAF